jgi:hypothetical protein
MEPCYFSLNPPQEASRTSDSEPLIYNFYQKKVWRGYKFQEIFLNIAFRIIRYSRVH